MTRPTDVQAAVARALSERWNRRQGKCIYPSNSTAEDWLESGDAQAAAAAVLREMPYETEYELAEEVKRLHALIQRANGLVAFACDVPSKELEAQQWLEDALPIVERGHVAS